LIDLACDFVDWLLKNAEFYSREEATRYATTFFNEGYIIPVKVEGGETLLDDKNLYRLQIPKYYPSRKIPTDKDYMVYLCTKHTYNAKSKKPLEDFENYRLNALKEKMLKQWLAIEEEVEKNIQMYASLPKIEQKLLKSYEAGFWEVQRPSPKSIEARNLTDTNRMKGRKDEEDENEIVSTLRGT
jgi:hypothetical protein